MAWLLRAGNCSISNRVGEDSDIGDSSFCAGRAGDEVWPVVYIVRESAVIICKRGGGGCGFRNSELQGDWRAGGLTTARGAAKEAGYSRFCAVVSHPLEQFSSSRGVFRCVQGGLFLRKRPLKRTGFPLQQLENRYSQKEGERRDTEPGQEQTVRNPGTCGKKIRCHKKAAGVRFTSLRRGP